MWGNAGIRYTFATLVALAACGTDVAPDPASNSPTWYRDVEPIVQVHCDGCHAAGGIGPVQFTPDSVGALASDIAYQTHNRTMPPWQPSSLGPALHGVRSITDGQIATIGAWATAGAPLGDPSDHGQLEPVSSFGLTNPDYSFKMAQPYSPDRSLTDDVRCFVIDLPFTSNTWLRAIRFDMDARVMVHHQGAGIVSGANKVAAHQLDDTEVDRDGINHLGFACPGGLRVPLSSGLGIGGPGAEGYEYPDDAGILVPGDSAIILTMHYYTPGAPNITDQSGVDFWVSSTPRRPMSQTSLKGPSDLPCPGGVTTGTTDPCSRDYAIAQEKTFTQPITRAINDNLQRRCGYAPADMTAGLDFSNPVADAFLITRQCELDVPYDGRVRVLESHMHTRGHSSRIEVLRAGTWQPLLDIPAWNWHWESTYLLDDKFDLHAGEKLRVTCVFDNGRAAQPPDPDHGGVPFAPGYVIAAEGRLDEMCGGSVWIERPPVGAPNLCVEAKQLYDGACPGLASVSTALWGGACAGNAEVLAAGLMTTPDASIPYYWCDVEPPAGAGSTCVQTLSCAASCTSQSCVDACTAAASALALHRYGRVMSCARQWCAPDTGSQWGACVAVACGPEFTKCRQ